MIITIEDLHRKVTVEDEKAFASLNRTIILVADAFLALGYAEKSIKDAMREFAGEEDETPED